MADQEAEWARRLDGDFVDLSPVSVEVIGTGWDHVALEVNGTLIFRIPRGVSSSELSTSVPYETEVLRHLRAKLPVAIPDPEYVAPDNTYFGYAKLPGVLVFDLVSELDASHEARLRQDWVTITSTIHRDMSLDVAQKFSVPVFDPAEILELASGAEADRTLSDSVRVFAQETVMAASKIDVGSGDLCFLHNDLHFKNVLADPLTKRITGVIDWSDCCTGPLAREFAVWEWGHDDSLLETAVRYEAVTGTPVDVQQAKLWKHLEELADLVEQKERGDERGARDSLSHIERWIAEAG